MQNVSNGQLYLAGLYFAVASLMTVGFGDIHPYTNSEMIFCVIWMIFGVAFYSMILGTLTSLLANIDAKKASLKELLNRVDDFKMLHRISD